MQESCGGGRYDACVCCSVWTRGPSRRVMPCSRRPFSHWRALGHVRGIGERQRGGSACMRRLQLAAMLVLQAVHEWLDGRSACAEPSVLQQHPRLPGNRGPGLLGERCAGRFNRWMRTRWRERSGAVAASRPCAPSGGHWSGKAQRRPMAAPPARLGDARDSNVQNLHDPPSSSHRCFPLDAMPFPHVLDADA